MKFVTGIIICCMLCSCQISPKKIATISGEIPNSANVQYSNLGLTFGIKYKEPIPIQVSANKSFNINTDSLGVYVLSINVNGHESSFDILIDQFETVKLKLQVTSDNSDDTVIFSNNQTLAAKYHKILEWYSETEKSLNDSEIVDELFGQIEATNDQELRELFCYVYLDNFFRDTDKDRILQMLDIVSPSSIIWELGAQLFGFMYFMLPEENHDLLDTYVKLVSEENYYPGIRAEAINYLLAHADLAEDSTNVSKYYKRLVTECPYSWRTKDARFKYEILAPGKRVPYFNLTSLIDSSEIYSEQTLLGKVYLLEFWTTTCGPCQMEIPYLHEAYQKYHQYGFEIISISLDDSPEDVIEYINNESEMPWTHVFLEGDTKSPMAKRFGIHSFPTPILVGRAGEILESCGNIRGERLLKRLEKIFIDT